MQYTYNTKQQQQPVKQSSLIFQTIFNQTFESINVAYDNKEIMQNRPTLNVIYWIVCMFFSALTQPQAVVLPLKT